MDSIHPSRPDADQQRKHLETELEQTETDNPKADITIGLVPSPDLPEALANKLAKNLPDYLSNYTDDQVTWEVITVTDPLTGATADSDELLEETMHCKDRFEWDYAVSITDLPIFLNKRLVVAEASQKRRSAWLSLPALGGTPILRRVQEGILQLINDMYNGSSEEPPKTQAEKSRKKQQGKRRWKMKGAKDLFSKRLFDLLSPIVRTTPDADYEVDVRYTIHSKIHGGWRMLTGMVRANRPWTAFPAFKQVIAAAFTSGAYGLIFPTLWQLSNALEPFRLLLLMVTAITMLSVWIVVVHGLWENTVNAKSPYIARLYNVSTVFTLMVAVTMYYITLFILFFIAVIVFIPGDILESQINDKVDFSNYITLAWLASSVGTIVGALGAALESEDTVLNTTYGYRQRRRYEESRDDDNNE
ncbi:YIP1 family protein [Virgibacillus senegalensis]|uniref:YIP1 family protein n=1 Tax=Virgibacillus senegalensis TaxID=1499679 RepID=UPI000AFA548A|nr:YIP1 family protein [Virgibacillus senegalensis]